LYKIAYLVTRSDQIGGSHIHVRDLAVALQKDGHQVVVYMGGTGPVIDHFKNAGLQVVSIPDMGRNISPVNDFKAFNHLKSELKEFNPDLVTSHSSKAGFLGRLISCRLKIPVIFTAHGWAFTDGKSSMSRSIFRILEKAVVPITDKIIAVSDYDRKLGIEELSLSDEKILTIHNGMNDIPAELMSTQDTSGPVNVVMVARFDHQKDQAELIRAAHKIENIHLHFVGDGHLRANAEKLADSLGMSNKITFWGELSNVEDILAKSQVFALISNWEGFPCSTLEAMRAGLPTIVSDVGGSAEAIVDGVTGFVVDKGDIESLHEILEDVVSDHEKRKKMGEAARRRFMKLYTFQTMYEKTASLYFEIIKNNKK
jgi:glycosyltransferase involved in cell wall biosynthesis